MPIPTILYHYHFQLFYYFKLQTSYPFTFLILNSESQYYFENLISVYESNFQLTVN